MTKTQLVLEESILGARQLRKWVGFVDENFSLLYDLVGITQFRGRNMRTAVRTMHECLEQLEGDLEFLDAQSQVDHEYVRDR